LDSNKNVKFEVQYRIRPNFLDQIEAHLRPNSIDFVHKIQIRTNSTIEFGLCNSNEFVRAYYFCPTSLTCILCPTGRERSEPNVGISLDVCRPRLHPHRTHLPTSCEGCGQPELKSNCGRGSVEWILPKVNFINIKHGRFSYERHFGSFFSKNVPMYVKKARNIRTFNVDEIDTWRPIVSLVCIDSAFPRRVIRSMNNEAL